MAYIPLPKIFDPSFADKQKKPAVECDIDWANPLSNGLYKAFFAHNAGFCDAVTHESYFNVSGITQKFGPTGEYNQCAGTQTVPITERIYGSTEDFTVSWLASKDVATSNDGMVCGDTGSNNYYIYQSGTSTQVSIKRSTETDVLAISGITHDQFIWRTIVVSASTSTVKYCADGRVTSSGIIGRQFKLNNITFGYNNSGNKYDGKFQDIIFHDRALTEAEVHALHADPYQILKPKQPTYITITEGGGGGSDAEGFLVSSALAQAVATGLKDAFGYVTSQAINQTTLQGLADRFGLVSSTGTPQASTTGLASLFGYIVSSATANTTTTGLKDGFGIVSSTTGAQTTVTGTGDEIVNKSGYLISSNVPQSVVDSFKTALGLLAISDAANTTTAGTKTGQGSIDSGNTSTSSLIAFAAKYGVIVSQTVANTLVIGYNPDSESATRTTYLNGVLNNYMINGVRNNYQIAAVL